MKYFRIFVSPKSRVYFDVYILNNHKAMNTYAKNKLKLSKLPDWVAICDRNINNNRIGRLFFNKKFLPEETVEHELIHMLISYIRHCELGSGVAELEDFVYNCKSNREEELAATFPYIKAQFNYKMGKSQCYLATAKKAYLGNLNFYKWDKNSKIKC